VHLRLCAVVAFAACLVALAWTAVGGSKAVSFCDLRQKVGDGGHMNVLVSGIFHAGLESTTLTDSACPIPMTWIEFDLKTQHNKNKLWNSLGNSRSASVVFEGEFYGPPLSDPNLPEVIRKNYHPSWGHLNCCDTKLVVHEIRGVKVAPPEQP
jgi:hypothetical protein